MTSALEPPQFITFIFILQVASTSDARATVSSFARRRASESRARDQTVKRSSVLRRPDLQTLRGWFNSFIG